MSESSRRETSRSVPHLTELCLDIQESSLLPGIDKPQTVGVRWQSLMSLHLLQSVLPVGDYISLPPLY